MNGKGAKRVVVATHGHCFDGMCSAALFTRLARTEGAAGASFVYRACGYGPAQNGVDPALLVGDDNAILDFRYSASPKLTWYFDHHKTAFPGADEQAHFEAEGGRQKFWDATYGSCTKLIDDVAREKFGLQTPPHLQELVRWADIIDAARFPSAEVAVLRTEPALQLMTVVEHDGDDAFLERLVPLLLERPLAEVAMLAEVQARWAPLRSSHEAFVALVQAHSTVMGDVVFVDLGDDLLEVAGKFVTYALFPGAMYSVMVTRAAKKTKLSIGYNPWCGRARRHDISAICVRHGGGGHPVVGAIALGAGEIERARALGQDIARELNA